MAKAKKTQSRSARNKRKFLAAFRECGNISQAARAAKIDRSCHYEWLEKSENYREEFKDAEEEAADLLEKEAVRRARDGWDEPVFQQGHQVGHWEDDAGNVVSWKDERASRFIPAVVRKYSDTLMVLLLKGHKPKKYRDRHEITGEDGAPIKVESGLRIEVVQSRNADSGA